MKKKEKKKITTEEATEALENGYSEAEALLNNTSKVDGMLIDVEEKLKTVPRVGGKLSQIPAFLSLLKCYITKQYDKVPTGTIIAVVSALLYFLVPSDLLPDFIPLVGYVDDASVISVCMSLVGRDIKKFIKWRDKKSKKNQLKIGKNDHQSKE